MLSLCGGGVGWGGGGGVCKVIFVSNQTAVLRLCCVVVGVVTIIFHSLVYMTIFPMTYSRVENVGLL